MEKFTIGIIQPANQQSENEELNEMLSSPTLSEICSLTKYNTLQQCIDKNDVDAIVMKSHNEDMPKQTGLTMIISDNTKITWTNGGELIDQIQQFADILQRDFDCLAPRIALLGETDASIIQQAEEKQICLFGPYTAEALQTDDCYQYFDGIFALGKDLATDCFKGIRAQYRFQYFAGQDTPIAAAYSSEPIDLTNALYTVMDICQNRDTYDEANENPLPKLYHEKREEKTRPGAFEKPKTETV